MRAINDESVCMELDTGEAGEAVTIMPEKQFQELFGGGGGGGIQLRCSHILFKTYTGERLSVVGECVVRVQHNGQSKGLVLTIVAGQGPTLPGRDCLKQLQLDWNDIHSISKHERGGLEYQLEKYSGIFSEELGTIRSFCAELNVDPTCS